MALKKFTALRFMTRFECAGSDCEDTCCRRWGVDIDQGHFVKLKRLLEREPGGKERVDAIFKLRDPAERTNQRFARLQFDEREMCPFLDEKQLCGLHVKYGEPVLPDICAHYPRVANVAGERLELSGELSCPEAVRGCLLVEEGTDLVDVPGYGGRPLYHHEYGRLQDEPYRAFLDEVRGTLYALMSVGDFSLASRLFFACHFAERTADHFHHQTEDFDEARLREAIEEIGDAAFQEMLHAQLRARPGDGREALSIVAQLLAVQTRMQSAPRFVELVRSVLQGYATRGEGVTLDSETKLSLSLANFWEAYHARRESLDALLGDRIERYFTNYAKHYFIRHWYTDSTDLFVYLQNLLLRLAVLRVLYVSHPFLDGISAMDQAAREAASDRAMVDATYSFSRTLEHFPFFLEKLDKVVAGQLTTLAHSALLLAI